jgi:hypothetical protein
MFIAYSVQKPLHCAMALGFLLYSFGEVYNHTQGESSEADCSLDKTAKRNVQCAASNHRNVLFIGVAISRKLAGFYFS